MIPMHTAQNPGFGGREPRGFKSGKGDGITMNILAFESSCDETAAAVVKDGRTVLSSVIASSADMHATYGGVVPEIASRQHVEAIVGLADEALRQAGLAKGEIDAVAVTYAPGLIGALLVGVSFAKSVAYGLGVPLIPVHHVRGHIAANYIAHPDLEPPFLCLCVSGGTTALVDVQDYTRFQVMGGTRDDAAGECFDKTARVLGLGYPGGGPMDKMAQGGDDKAFVFPRAHVADHPLDMSFSGLKTAVLNTIHNAQQKGQELNLHDLAASFAAAVSDSLVPRVMEAARELGYDKIVTAGGVAANSRIRADLTRACQEAGARLWMPPLSLCGDNAAMIGCQGYYEYQAGHTAGWDLNGKASLDISLG